MNAPDHTGLIVDTKGVVSKMNEDRGDRTVSGTVDKRPGWGVRESDGLLVHVNDVPNGRECGCHCPVCKSPFIARQGKVRTWHFAHATKVNCDGAGETALHQAAKQILKDSLGRVFIPDEVIRKIGWPASPSHSVGRARRRLDDLMKHVFAERLVSPHKVRLEPQDWIHQGFRPDAVLEGNKGSRLLVEIRVTHEVDEEKRNQMRKVGLGAFEIDLSKTERTIQPEYLKRQVVEAAPRAWLVTGRKKACEKLEAEFTAILEAEACRLNEMVPRALTRDCHVNACPRRNEPDYEKVYIYKCFECEHSGGHLEAFENTPLWKMLDKRIRDANVASVLCAQKDDPRDLPTDRQKGFVHDLADDDLKWEGGLTERLPEGWRQDRVFCEEFIRAHPDCGKCGWKMALRRSGEGRLFWGCGNYPICKGTSSHQPAPVLEGIVMVHEKIRREEHARSEKKATRRAALARPEPPSNSLSQRATVSRRRRPDARDETGGTDP